MTDREMERMYDSIHEVINEVKKTITLLRMNVLTPRAVRTYLAECERACWKLAECFDEAMCISYASEENTHVRGGNSDHTPVEDDLLMDVEINEDDILAWIEMAGRLPSRKSMSSGRQSAGSEYTHLMDRVIRRAFIDHPDFHMSGKAELLIYCEYKTFEGSRDADNTNVKPLIDALCRACNMDDSIADLRLTLDGAVTGRNHVTIIMAPVKVFDILREDIMRRLEKGGKADGKEEN